MAIYAYGTPSHPKVLPVYDSLTKENISRFMWSNFHDCDLNRLKDIQWNEMNSAEQDSWCSARRLLEFVPGDWILHKNVPEYGKVTAARVVSNYLYQAVPSNPDLEKLNDGRHCFKVDEVFTFDRNDPRVHPLLSARLKLQGRLYRISCEKEFFESMQKLKDNVPVTPNHYLKEDVEKLLKTITEKIHQNNPRKELEKFLAEVFKNVPNVTEVKENGSGWGTDYGADLIVTYNSQVIGDWCEEKILVVQVKSYEGYHWDTNAVNQLKTAIDEYKASAGLIITTGERTEELEKRFNELADEMKDKNVSIFLLAGNEVAKFVLKYWKEIQTV